MRYEAVLESWDTDTETETAETLDQVQPKGWFQWIKLKAICFCRPIRSVLTTILWWSWLKGSKKEDK